MPRIAIVFDEDFTPWGEPEIIAEETEKIGAGEWTAYGVIAFEDCDQAHGIRCPHATALDSLWGCVVDTGTYEGTYDSPAEIQDAHLRGVAADLLP